MWLVSAGWLRSVTQEFDWPPGGIVEAHKLGIPLGEGIHAFKHRAQAIEMVHQMPRQTVAVGQVALWGNIVEFEHGWHAEFAKVLSITNVYYASDDETRCAHLRETYGVGGYVRPE